MSRHLLHIKQLAVSYSKKKQVLSQVNLQLNEGEITVVIGENGSGKSTLLQSICGLLPYEEGSAQLYGKEVSAWENHELSKTIAYVSSRENRNTLLRVEDFVGFGRYPYSNWLAKPTEEDLHFIQEALEQCRIEYLRGKNMQQLSDGECQKVFLARAIAQQTPFIVLDEPTTHLDIKSTTAIFQLLNVQKEKGRSILFSSHQVEKALRIADKIWLVDKGKVVETTPDEFNGNEALKKLIFGDEL